MIRFIAYEGFAKLLLNKCWLPNKHMYLSKLIVHYITEEKIMADSTETNTTDEDQLINNRLKACLGLFFEKFIQTNKENLDELIVRSFMPTLKYAVNKNASHLSKKKLSDFFYYLTYNTQGKRQLMITKVLDEVFLNFEDFKLVNRWIEVLVELNIHQLDIDEEDEKELSTLTKIANQLLKITVNNPIFFVFFLFVIKCLIWSFLTSPILSSDSGDCPKKLRLNS